MSKLNSIAKLIIFSFALAIILIILVYLFTGSLSRQILLSTFGIVLLFDSGLSFGYAIAKKEIGRKKVDDYLKGFQTGYEQGKLSNDDEE